MFSTMRGTRARATHLARALRVLAVFALVVAGSGTSAPAQAAAPTFPRLMGMNIGAKNYDDPAYQGDLARLDVVLLGFYKGWAPRGYAPDSVSAIRRAVREIKARNPAMLIGQYVVLNEMDDDPANVAVGDMRDKLYASNWWLTNAAQRKVQWTKAYGTYEVNFTAWTQPDANGQRWPQWLAGRNYGAYFRDIPEFDIVYLDNVMAVPRVRGDWNLDGILDDPLDPVIAAAYRAGHVAHWREIRRLQPQALLIGNADNDLSDPVWKGQLDGAFLESMMGESWSIEWTDGWKKMMERYRAVIANTGGPKIVGFNVSGNPNDLRFFRYAYTSCLLDNGYFSFTDKARGHSSVPWFDEYNFKLGKAVEAPPGAAWTQGVWRRNFENGVVLVNPTKSTRTVTVETGLRRLDGNQDRNVNDGSAARVVTLAPQDGIVLRR